MYYRMKVEFDDARFHLRVLGDTQEIRNCIRDTIKICNTGRYKTPRQLRSDIPVLGHIVDQKSFDYGGLERIAYNRERLDYAPQESADAPLIKEHYQALKHIWGSN